MVFFFIKFAIFCVRILEDPSGNLHVSHTSLIRPTIYHQSSTKHFKLNLQNFYIFNSMVKSMHNQ